MENFVARLTAAATGNVLMAVPTGCCSSRRQPPILLNHQVVLLHSSGKGCWPSQHTQLEVRSRDKDFSLALGETVGLAAAPQAREQWGRAAHPL